jgi:hypothetical protein
MVGSGRDEYGLVETYGLGNGDGDHDGDDGDDGDDDDNDAYNNDG